MKKTLFFMAMICMAVAVQAEKVVKTLPGTFTKLEVGPGVNINYEVSDCAPVVIIDGSAKEIAYVRVDYSRNGSLSLKLVPEKGSTQVNLSTLKITLKGAMAPKYKLAAGSTVDITKAKGHFTKFIAELGSASSLIIRGNFQCQSASLEAGSAAKIEIKDISVKNDIKVAGGSASSIGITKLSAGRLIAAIGSAAKADFKNIQVQSCGLSVGAAAGMTVTGKTGILKTSVGTAADLNINSLKVTGSL